MLVTNPEPWTGSAWPAPLMIRLALVGLAAGLWAGTVWLVRVLV